MELTIVDARAAPRGRRLPPWLKRPLPFGNFARTRDIVARSGLATVCVDAKCPNLSECWSRGTATFMIMGHDCTRRCRFCAVHTARPLPLEPDEPHCLALAVRDMGLQHVVITAVARDDLPDEGAAHFGECVRQTRRHAPQTTVEVLPADFHARPECLARLVAAGPDIYNHNIETVQRLHPTIRPQAKYERSLEVLRLVKQLSKQRISQGAAGFSPRDFATAEGSSGANESRRLKPAAPWGRDHIGGAPAEPVGPALRATKSGVMVGLGETFDELLTTFRDLYAVGVDILTIGQYLQPTQTDHAKVEKFYPPQEFDALAEQARAIGFKYVASGPFVRSSYNAGEVFAALLPRPDIEAVEA